MSILLGDRIRILILLCLIVVPSFLWLDINGQIATGVITVEAEHAITCQGWRMVKGISGKAMQDDSERGQGWLRYELEFDQTGQ